MSDHLGDDAELYALGMLDADERERVDAHVATCERCLRDLGAAERTVSALVVTATRAPRTRVPRWTMALAGSLGGALAAALVLAASLYRGLVDDGTALDRLATSHFVHVQFASPAGQPLAVKAVYARDGRWVTLVAAGAAPWRVVAIALDGTRQVEPERFVRRGAASYATLVDVPPVRALELEDAAGTVVGIAHPQFTSSP